MNEENFQRMQEFANYVADPLGAKVVVDKKRILLVKGRVIGHLEYEEGKGVILYLMGGIEIQEHIMKPLLNEFGKYFGQLSIEVDDHL